MTSTKVGSVQTVTGLVEPHTLGITHTHEHIFIDSTGSYFAPHPDAPERADEKVGLDNRWWVEHNCFNVRDNLSFDSVEETVREVALFQEVGGGSLVDVTNIGLGRNPEKLRALSAATGLKLIMGAGWYIAASHPAEIADIDERQLADIIVRDVDEGVGETGVKAGITGELGVSVPFHEAEKKVLRAAVIAQKETGVPISIHPGMDDDVLLEIVDLLRTESVDFENVIMCHLDSFGYSRETRMRVAETGCFLEFDCFGYTNFMNTATLGTPNGLPHPSDSERIDDLAFFIDQGHGEQIVLSQDLFFKHARTTYGGHGYSHILRNRVPMMNQLGFAETDLDNMLVNNPARALTFTNGS